MGVLYKLLNRYKNWLYLTEGIAKCHFSLTVEKTTSKLFSVSVNENDQDLWALKKTLNCFRIQIYIDKM